MQASWSHLLPFNENFGNLKNINWEKITFYPIKDNVSIWKGLVYEWNEAKMEMINI